MFIFKENPKSYSLGFRLESRRSIFKLIEIWKFWKASHRIIAHDINNLPFGPPAELGLLFLVSVQDADEFVPHFEVLIDQGSVIVGFGLFLNPFVRQKEVCPAFRPSVLVANPETFAVPQALVMVVNLLVVDYHDSPFLVLNEVRGGT